MFIPPFLYKSGKEDFNFEIKPDPGSRQEEVFMEYVSVELDVNRDYVSKKFCLPANGDIVVRDISFFAGKTLQTQSAGTLPAELQQTFPSYAKNISASQR